MQTLTAMTLGALILGAAAFAYDTASASEPSCDGREASVYFDKGKSDVTNDFSSKAFNDPVTGKSFGQQFITQNKPDVIFQVAGKTGNGVVDAACDAGIYAIGVDVDQWLSYPNGQKCIITSAEKHVESAVAQAIESIAAGNLAPGDVLYNAKNDGISAADFHDKASLFGPEVTTALQTALAGMQAGTLVTCPPAPACGTYTP